MLCDAQREMREMPAVVCAARCAPCRWFTPTTRAGVWVERDPAFLMAFETDEATVYQIRFHHLNGEVRELIHADNGGVMVKDRGSFRSSNLSGVRQRKCMAHVIRSVSEVVQT